MWDNLKWPDMCVIEVRGVGRGNNNNRNNGQNLMKTVNSYEEKHIIMRLHEVNDKKKILKASREKDVIMCRGINIKIIADF